MSKELLEAASNGEIDKVKKLLDQKDVNINVVNQEGNTALCLAVINGHENIADFLIKKNADINIQNNRGWTVLNYAIGSGRLSLFGLIMTKNPDLTAKIAVIKGSQEKTHTALCQVFQLIEIVSSKIQFNRSQNDLTRERNKIIAECSTDMNILEKIAKQLIDAKAKTNEISQVVVSFMGDKSWILKSTAFSLAMNYESIELASVLRGDVNEKSENDNSYLQNALMHKNIPMACFLLEKGANPNQQDGFFPPFLSAVALEGSERLVQLFIEKGADVNQVTPYKTTPLSEAVSAGNIQVAELLIEKGAKITDRVKEVALERVSTFCLIVENTIKNRSKEMSEQAILHEFFNKILILSKGEIAFASLKDKSSHIHSLMLYLLECGLELEMPSTIHDYTTSDKYRGHAYSVHYEIFQMFECADRYEQYTYYLQRDDINFNYNNRFKNLTRNGKVVYLNHRRKADGNTWLHIAINGNLNMAAALILLGSRLDIPNYKNETVAQLIRDKPCFLILVKIKRVIDWVEERNARATNNATKIDNLPPHGISHLSTSLVDVKMEKDRPIFNQYKMSNATAATGTAGSSGAAALSDRSLPNAKEEIEKATDIKALNETHNVESEIKQIYDDIGKIQPKVDNFYVGFLLSELIVKNPDLFNGLLGFAYKFLSEIKKPIQPSPLLSRLEEMFKIAKEEFSLANEYCFKLLSVAYKYQYQFKSENQDSKLTIIPCKNKQDTKSLEIENRRLLKKHQMEHRINSGKPDLSLALENCDSGKNLKSPQNQQDEIEKLRHENALLKMQIQDLQKTTQRVLLAGQKRKQK